jgi:hypothetical protein
MLRKIDQMHVRVKGIYEVSMTPQAAQFRVWTGRVESKIYDFALSQWCLGDGRESCRPEHCR